VRTSQIRLPLNVSAQAKPEDLADALAFALRYSGRKRASDAGEMMAAIVAKRRAPADTPFALAAAPEPERPTS